MIVSVGLGAMFVAVTTAANVGVTADKAGLAAALMRLAAGRRRARTRDLLCDSDRAHDPPVRASRIARARVSRSARSVARTAPCQSSTRQVDAHSVLRGSLDGMAPPIRQPAPAADTNKTCPQPSASRTPENWAARMHGMHQPDEQSGCPCKGTKRARIGRASGYTHR